ncbi:DUF4157 domain-containing protein [Danxiaibacter flavus]|uniref:DUF4157 domain-containing protein n=1 Tax=Danxiaibacter flavus TaxID=3049108 RepID=A0ABV3ZBH1_9BACT|nr:DUF4157 domain-containing protein [Chitinophagaceae bacterium DXS]
MHTKAGKTAENKSVAIANMPVQKQGEQQPVDQFVDNRPEALAQRKLRDAINNSPRVQQLKAYQAMADHYAVNGLMQRKETEDEEPLQGKFTGLEKEETNELQTRTLSTPVQKQSNNTGLPDNLKSGIENLSGYSMDDVKVHYNSDKPAQMQAHAYAQGTDIHVAPGQEQHLPHEAWHVVQQKQGRVQATMQMKSGVSVNDDKTLEHEADVMGAKAVATGITTPQATLPAGSIQRKENIIQAKSYTTTANKNRLGLAGSVDVTAGDTSITLAGTLKNGANQDVPATGTVYIPQYKTDKDRSKEPVAEKDRGWFEKRWDPADALRVMNLSADPRGMKLGQLLTYHHGLEAQRQGKPYVIAMKVSDARGPFYTPLGFTDYNGSRPYDLIKQQRDDIDALLRSQQGAALGQQEVSAFVEKRTELTSEMEASSMIISTEDLINNSQQQLQTIWNG